MKLHFIANSEKAAVALIAVVSLMSVAGCSSVRPYSNATARTPPFEYVSVYDTIIDPLRISLIPIYKRIFFLKNDIAELKDRLWDGGTDQRIMRIDDNIDRLRKEVYALSDIKKEILNTIYQIYPPYVTPEVVPYIGKKKSIKKKSRPIILVSREDQREYENAKMNEEIMSEEINVGPVIASVIKKYDALPDSLKKPIEPIGTAGPVPRIRPYVPPPLYRVK